MVQSSPPAEVAQSADFAQPRGWFYRVIAPDAGCAVLEVGDARLASWFDNVVSRNLDTPGGRSAASGPFDVVVIHHSLGGCATLRAAMHAARGELRQGGMLAVTGTNRLRRAPRVGSPRATGWGLRREMDGAGFTDISLYVTHPPARDPIYVIDAHPRPARAFFEAQIAAQPWPAWSPKRILLGALVASNLMPYLQPEFIIVGRKC